jgi:hypothetical protein
MSAIAVRAKLDQRSYRRARVSPDGHSSRLMAQVPRCARLRLLAMAGKRAAADESELRRPKVVD